MASEEAMATAAGESDNSPAPTVIDLTTDDDGGDEVELLSVQHVRAPLDDGVSAWTHLTNMPERVPRAIFDERLT